MRAKGFTLIEILMVVSVVAIVFGYSLAVMSSVQKVARSQEATSGLLHVLSVTNENAMQNRSGDSWGVYLDYNETSRDVNEYIIFLGGSYATRDVAYDRTYTVDSAAQITDASLSGASPSDGNDHEVVFSALSGETPQYGNITIESLGLSKTLNISRYGWAVWE
ncbi:type II secretion system protein [Candidatus Uhrbacteria bacterium]|jgi:prepilin-type N-terminal cleavage/methylation domain-containing protein|nr:type II secretion system protein [Candidatus Uhrbacteria bacterium]